MELASITFWQVAVLFVLIFISMPSIFISSYRIVSHSETHDYSHYLEFDEMIPVSSDNMEYAFFATKPRFYEIIDGKKVESGKYFYRNLPRWNYTYDIYAEWSVTQEELESELARVNELFEKKTGGKRVNIQNGTYMCVILYYGQEPFKPVSDNYTYFIFAYDETDLRVRYVLCDSLEHGDDQPYYLELDWGDG